MHFYCSFLASTPFLLPFLLFDISQLVLRSPPPEGCQPTLPWPSSQTLPSRSAGTFRGAICYETVLPVGVQFKSALCPPGLKLQHLHPNPKEKCAWHCWEKQLSTPGNGEGFCGEVWVVQHHAVLVLTYPIPSAGVMQRVIKMAGCDSKNITTFSHLNQIRSSQAFHAHSI